MLILKEPTTDSCGWGLEADEFNIVLGKLTIAKEGKMAGTVRKTNAGYYSSVGACLRGIAQKEVGLFGLEDLEALDKHIRSVMSCCSDSVKEFEEKYTALMNSGGLVKHGNDVA